MPTRPIRRWTLRELLNGSDRACRELVDRIRKEILPTMRELDRMLHRRRTTETMVENATRQLLRQTSDFDQQLSRLEEISQAISKQAQRQVEEMG